VLSEDVPSGIDNIPRFLFETFFEEFFHRDFADETESLTILPVGIREACLFGDRTDLGFVEMSDRKEGMCKLKLTQT